MFAFYKGKIKISSIYYEAIFIQTFVPSCEACVARANGATDALAWEETIVAWVYGLQNDGFCDATANPKSCKEAVAWLIPLALPALVDYPRGWLVDFCTGWGACHA